METAVGSIPSSSKTGEPHLELINAMLMNLSNASEKQPPKKCQHFTLRGYVAEMRKKDWKKTWPFPICYYNSTSEDECPTLPPMEVPEFKRWNCHNCLQEIGVKPSDAHVGAALVPNTNVNGSKVTGTNLSSLRGSAMSSGSHQPSKPATMERIEIDLNKSVTVDSSKDLSSSGNDSDGEAKMTETAITGNDTILKHTVQEPHDTTSIVAVEVNSGLMPETQTGEMVSNAVPVISKCNGAVVLNKAGHGNHDTVDVDFLDSEEEDIFEASVVSANHDATSTPLHRRKPRKTRLLIDLLGEDENPKAKHLRVDDLSISQTQNAPIRSGAVPVGLDTEQENFRSSKGHNRKRKLSQGGGGAELTGANGCFKLKDASVQLGTSKQPDHSKIGGQAIPFHVKEGQTSLTRQEGRHHFVSSAQDSFIGQSRAIFDLNSKATPFMVPNLNDRQPFEAEDAPLFAVQSSGFPPTTSSEVHMKTQGGLASRRKYGDQQGKTISEQGAVDDVPMDIVELMAKNQYERRLGSSVSMSTPKQANAPQWLFNTNSKRLDWSSNGVQFSASSSSRPSNNHGVKRNADILGQRSRYTNMQAIGMCNTRPPPQRGEEAASHWPSRTPNHMPLLCNIPPNCSARPMNMDVPSHYPWQKGNPLLNLNAPIVESCSRNFPTENYGRTHAEYPQPSKHARIDLNQSPMGPLDLNSKETISAMQLLSLMDAGMRSGPSFSADPMPKFFNRTSRPPVGCLHEFSSSQSMITKTSGTLIPAQSNNRSMHCHLERSNRYFQSVSAAEASTSMQRNITGSFNPVMRSYPSGFETVGSSSSAFSSKRASESEECTLNQNPADLTVPGPNNEYMIQPQDLTFRDTIPPKSRSKQMNASQCAVKKRVSRS